MASNPLGISTGQGKGLAQVFGDTYNDYYAKKADEGLKKKEELASSMAEAEDAEGLWNRDYQKFKPKLEELRSYYVDNARDIMKGDFDALVNLRKKQDELKQFVQSSKFVRDEWNKRDNIIANNPNKFSEESIRRHKEFALENNAGNFGLDYTLEGDYKPGDTIEKMKDELSKVQYVEGNPISVNIGGKDFAMSTADQRKEAARLIVNSQVKAALEDFPTQAAKYWTPERIEEEISKLESMLGRKVEFKQIGDGRGDGGDKDPVEIPNVVQESSISVIEPLYAEGDIVGKNDNIKVYNSVPLNQGKIRMSSNVVRDNAIPVKGVWGRKERREDGKQVPVKARAEAAEEYDIKKLRDIISSTEEDYEVSDVFVADAFTSDSKGAQGKQDIGGLLVPSNYELAEGQKSEPRFYARLINSSNDKVILVPFKNIQENLRYGLKSGFYDGLINKYKELAESDPKLAKALEKDMIGYSGGAKVSPMEKAISTVMENNPGITRQQAKQAIIEASKKNK